MEVKIVKMGINGEGIGYIDKKPVFINDCFIEEVVKIENIQAFKGYYKADLAEVIKASRYRIKPQCYVYNLCHSCNLMEYKYEKQLEFKRKTLVESLIKYAHVDPKLVSDVEPSHRLFYRNQCKLPLKMIKKELCSGMYQANSNHLVYFDKCIIHEENLEKVRQRVRHVLNVHHARDYNEKIQKGYRYLVLRGFDNKFQLTLVTGKNDIDQHIIDDLLKIDEIVSIYQNINLSKNNVDIMSNNFKHLAKEKTLKLKVNDISLSLYPNSFFQLNYHQACKLYNDVVDCIEDCNLMVEAYCGIGAMSLLASKKCKKIIGIENVNNAIINAKDNAKANNIDNIKFICDDAANSLVKIKEKIDYLLVDPPRTGLNDKMIKAILANKPEHIIYVSCNPSTLAKNLNELKDAYKINKIKPYDMFAQTCHVETVVLLTKAHK